MAPPGIQLEQRVITYSISGETASELRDALESSDIEDTGHPAAMAWDVDWLYRYGPAPDGRCVLSDIRVSLRIVTTLPTWEPPAGVDLDLVSRWEHYLNALTFHERGHAQNALDHAALILAGLRGQAPADTCDHLESNANAAADQITLDAQRADLTYDRETSHGESQGADPRLLLPEH